MTRGPAAVWKTGIRLTAAGTAHSRPSGGKGQTMDQYKRLMVGLEMIPADHSTIRYAAKLGLIDVDLWKE